jgi:3-hydroxyisobutyrate dehydrogenase
VKAVNNALLAQHLIGTAEGLLALTKAGVAPAVALDVINASSGRSNSSQNLFPERVLTRAFPRTFRLALLDKDVGIAAGVAREQGVSAPLLDAAAALYRAAHDALGEEADHVEIVNWLEARAGVELKCSATIFRRSSGCTTAIRSPTSTVPAARRCRWRWWTR